MVLALRSHAKNNANLHTLAKNRQIPIYTRPPNRANYLGHHDSSTIHIWP